MKESRRSSPIIHRKSVLTCRKAEFTFFFYLAFFSRIFTIHRTAGDGDGYPLISFLPLTPTSQSLRHQPGYCCRELIFTQLTVGLKPGTSGTSTLEFALSTLKMAVAAVLRMLKTWLPLGNISHVLLNLIKRLIFVIFKVYFSLPMLTQLAFIVSLQFNNYGCFTS